MKYEMIFGDQGLFGGAPEDALIAIKRPFISGVRSEEMYFFSSTFDAVMKAGSSFNFNNVILKTDEYAERRIIAEPKRWTVEDQKAGLLPDVGCEYIGRDVLLTCVFVDKNRDVWGKSKDNLMHCHNYSEIKPIETSEEKAARLREEWCIKALRYNSQSGSKVEAIYDALLSGELTMPNKDGE